MPVQHRGKCVLAQPPEQVCTNRRVQPTTATSKTDGDALVSNEPRLPDLVGLSAMFSQLWLLSCRASEHSVDEARGPRKAALAGFSIDPLGEFSEAARKEVRPLMIRVDAKEACPVRLDGRV
jgi:hypothetical protein